MIARVDNLQTIIHGSSSCSNEEEGIPVGIRYSCANLRTAHFGYCKFAPPVPLGLFMDFVARNQMPDQTSWMYMVQALFYPE